MYTVFRLSSKSETNIFTDAKKAFEEISPGLLKNTRHKSSMACSVYDGQDWIENQNKIREFVEKHKEIFSAFGHNELFFSFDMAVNSDDAGEGFFCSFYLDHELLFLLSENKINIEFTAYYPIDVDDDEDDEESLDS